MISTATWRSYKNLLRQTMIPFLTCSCQHHPKVELLPTRCSCPMWWRNVHHLPKSACICNQLRSRAWLYNLQHTIMGRNWYATLVLNKPNHMKFNLVWYYLFSFYILFCKGLKMMASDKINTASRTYVHVLLSLCHLYTLPVTWRIQMRTLKRYFFHAILLTTLDLREMN
jgi:hypothetical protein